MKRSGSGLWWYGLSASLVCLCAVQLRWQGYFAIPLLPSPCERLAAALILFLFIPIACWGALAGSWDGWRTRAIVVVFGIFAAAFCEVVHHEFVDLGRYDPAYPNNLAWQLNLHRAVLRLEAGGATPHSYRFLPDCIVSFFQWLAGSFDVARVAYRLLANGLLFVMIYRYGRIYLTQAFALGAVLLVAFLYPVTIMRYAGQLTDPASHLSFAVCLFCLGSGIEAGFQSSLFVGVLAKESILAVAVCRAFYGSNRLKSAAAAAAYFAIAAGIALGIRRYVNQGPIPIAFTSISGTHSNKLLENLADWRIWWAMFAVTLGALLPGAIAGWRLMDGPFRATCATLAAATLGSNLAIGLFWEERNIVPAFIPLAVVNLRYLQARLLQKE